MTQDNLLRVNPDEIRIAAIEHLAADDAYDACRGNDQDPERLALGEAMDIAYERFTQVIGFGFAASSGEVARFLVALIDSTSLNINQEPGVS